MSVFDTYNEMFGEQLKRVKGVTTFPDGERQVGSPLEFGEPQIGERAKRQKTPPPLGMQPVGRQPHPMQSLPQENRGALLPEPENEASFESMFKKQSPEVQKKAVADLESQGVNINQSYADLMHQIDEPVDESLTKKEKGMLIMEFGLNLMARSGAGGLGDTGGAIGQAGTDVMGSYKQLIQQKRQNKILRAETRRGALADRDKARQEQEKMDISAKKVVEDDQGQHVVDVRNNSSRRVAGNKPVKDAATQGKEQQIKALSNALAKDFGDADKANDYATRIVLGGAKDPAEFKRIAAQAVSERLANSLTESRAVRSSGMSEGDYIAREAEKLYRVFVGLENPTSASAGSTKVDSDPLAMR